MRAYLWWINPYFELSIVSPEFQSAETGSSLSTDEFEIRPNPAKGGAMITPCSGIEPVSA